MSGKYFLHPKTVTSFQKYKGDAIKLSKSLPYTVEEIVVGKTNDPTFKRTITTFRDSKGKPIERSFDFSDRLLRNRIYTRDDKVIGEDKFVSSTEIRQYSLPHYLIKTYNEFKEAFSHHNIENTLWKKEKVQTNHLSENINTGAKILSVVKIDAKQPTKEIHSFIEYPAIVNDKLTKGKKKFLQYQVNSKQGTVDLNSIKSSDNVVKPTNDSFLAYRALSINDAKEPLAKHFIKKRKLDKTGINISTTYTDLNEKLLGLYYDGTIYFNRLYKYKSKTKLVGTTRHEVEHAWQYLLDARNTGGTEPNLIEMGKKAGPIKGKKLQEEADKYSEAIANYVPPKENFEQYKNNYIEVMANKAGAKAKIQYDTEGETIRSNFKHIPKEYL